MKRDAETIFLGVLERQDGFQEILKAIRLYWYKKNGLPPIPEERRGFFGSFVKLY